ncbi:LysR family transcriptional regulator [Pelagibacterium mangrovi]|uniref:LysR family transcriptional regulator n=1 Tax=Pelagibacterium mangrovi TaxID=3119828 RepID=UPI002FCC032A
MDISWLQDFLTVAETKNFTKAAQRRNSSQGAFSRRIQSLEAWLGTPLFDRSIFPVEMTPEGERFHEHARDVLEQILNAPFGFSGLDNTAPKPCIFSTHSPWPDRKGPTRHRKTATR